MKSLPLSSATRALFQREQTSASSSPNLSLRDDLPSAAVRTVRGMNSQIASPKHKEKKDAWIYRVAFNRSVVAWVSGISRKLGTHPHSVGGGPDRARFPFPEGQTKNCLS
jgi:hypothetical protein